MLTLQTRESVDTFEITVDEYIYTHKGIHFMTVYYFVLYFSPRRRGACSRLALDQTFIQIGRRISPLFMALSIIELENFDYASDCSLITNISFF